VALGDHEVQLAYELAANAGAFKRSTMREPYRLVSKRSNEEKMAVWRERRRLNHKRRRARAD
jgi:hypothetical protein